MHSEVENLVERLRREAAVTETNSDDPYVDEENAGSANLMREAASLIESLYRERDAAVASSDKLKDRLQAIIDWADLALANPSAFAHHGVRNLDGPVFDEARAALAQATIPQDAQ